MRQRYRLAVTELGLPERSLPENIARRSELVLGSNSGGMGEGDLIRLVKGADALLFSSRDPITPRVMDAGEKLRILVKFGGKPSNLNFAEAAARGLAVAWTPGANVRSVAEYALFLALAGLRRVDRGLATLQAGGWRSGEHIGLELTGKVVGVLGLGAIGSTVAALFSAVGCEVLAHDPHQADARFSACGARRVDLRTVLASADVLTLHCELTPETRGVIGREALALMKPHAVLVNTARGELVDETALVEALASGRFGAAALDVFAVEPLPADHPFRQTPGIIATPHIAARSREAIERERAWALRGAVAFLDGLPVENMSVVEPSPNA